MFRFKATHSLKKPKLKLSLLHLTIRLFNTVFVIRDRNKSVISITLFHFNWIFELYIYQMKKTTTIKQILTRQISDINVKVWNFLLWTPNNKENLFLSQLIYSKFVLWILDAFIDFSRTRWTCYMKWKLTTLPSHSLISSFVQMFTFYFIW